MLRSHRGYGFDFAEVTDPGLHPDKQVNEDLAGSAETAHGFLAIVCDGMGGHEGGQLASRTAVATILEQVQTAAAGTDPKDILANAVRVAAGAVYNVGAEGIQYRPGSTCVAMLIHEGGTEVAHVGDSRAYLLRAGVLTPLTRDHSVVRELLDRGDITEEEALNHPDTNQITRALGMAPEVEVEMRANPASLMVGDVLMMCTDGLTDLAVDEEIGTLMKTHLEVSPEKAATMLIEVAKMRGAHDNVTVQIIRIEQVPTAAVAASAPAAHTPALGGGTVVMAEPAKPPTPKPPAPAARKPEPQPPAPQPPAPQPPTPQPPTPTPVQAASAPTAPTAPRSEPNAGPPPLPRTAPPARPAALDQLNLPSPYQDTTPDSGGNLMMIMVSVLALAAGIVILLLIVGVGGGGDD